MKLATSKQMQEIDRIAIEDMLIPSALLMRNAARYVALEAIKFMPEGGGGGGKCAVFSGSGNNGGDGIAAAFELIKKGYKVRVFLTGKREKMTPDSLEMEKRLNEAQGQVELFEGNEKEAALWLRDCSVIIDAMFGIGLNSELRESALAAMDMINNCPARVVAADVASGVEADTGQLLGGGVKADVTVTFTMPKPGQFIEPGATYSGKIIVCDIGIPKEIYSDLEYNTKLVTERDISLPKRAANTHKGDYGKLLMICGSMGYTGAPTLASSAAVRSGAGLVFLGVPESIYEITAAKCEEAMPYPLEDDEQGRLSRKAIHWILKKMKTMDACLIGPGLGRSRSVTNIVSKVIKNSQIPLIIDADGINAISENINILDEATCPIILTPHEGEFARLVGSGLGRLKSAKAFAAEHNCTVVLKGPGTISVFPDGEVYVNTTGNPGMAKGGSGDVLAGIIAALIGQGLEYKKAVYTAVWIHGKAGDVLEEEFGSYAMLPSEMIDALPEVLKKIVR